MANVPATVTKRLTKQVPRYQKLLKNARDNKVNEADTVTIVIDMLNEVFGFDKYSEITKEYQIRKTFCDVAVKIEGKIRYLVEVKSIVTILKDDHIRQAVNYGAREGIEWVVLTNGADWQVYRILFKRKPLTHEQVCNFDFMKVNPKTQEGQETLFMLCKRGVKKTLFEEIYERQQVVNEHTIAAALMMSDEVHKVIARELKKLEQNAKPDKDEIAKIVKEQVITPRLVDNEKTKSVVAKTKRMQKKLAKEKADRAANENKGPQEEE